MVIIFGAIALAIVVAVRAVGVGGGRRIGIRAERARPQVRVLADLSKNTAHFNRIPNSVVVAIRIQRANQAVAIAVDRRFLAIVQAVVVAVAILRLGAQFYLCAVAQSVAIRVGNSPQRAIFLL